VTTTAAVMGDVATLFTLWQFVRKRPECCATGFGWASLRIVMPRGPRLDARDLRWTRSARWAAASS